MDTDSGAGPETPESADADGGEDPDSGTAADSDEGGPARHYSTGKLTRAQARIVDSWRGELARSRPRASASDCIAAAVIDLLDRAEPDHLALIRYADRVRERLAAERAQAFPSASVVSFYLPADYAARLDTLLDDAQTHHADLLDRAREQVNAELPDRKDRVARAMRMMSTVAAMNIPFKVYKLPAGTLARLAIERWSRRSPTTVVNSAVGHSEYHHEQLHRTRRDLGVGQSHY
ncbi:hypothetical protein [Nocardia noduli]|uniref:hypothetical protein n=1 Tax=Nocardia noduli TaxID=2815722 RepID=UPI001C22EF9C|nr:hypothetical protein [Nocardia noduli]